MAKRLAPVKNKLRKCELDFPALKQSLSKEQEKERAEYRKDIEQVNREEGRDSNGRKSHSNNQYFGIDDANTNTLYKTVVGKAG